ncbi:AIPR family protein [Planococcus sp. N064]|uniref:AIPR family protein n=1 Tax=Planococcus liqunii TaxID=3058394 RepID=A0ABT8MSJ7_9BACL|nr:AIPR family protein [Planococcus sp. N064]MDN7227869.1 AIPR family protein [Planococcus sp. N064]
MVTLQEFHTDFLQTTLTVAESRGLLNAQSFFELVCEELVATGELSINYTEADLRILVGRNPMEAYGFDYDEERKILSVLTHEFFQEDQIETLTKSAVEKKYKRLNNFVIKSCEGLYKQLEETSPAYSMSYNIFKRFSEKDISKFKFFLLTDGQITKNYKEDKNYSTDEYTVETRIIDIEYLYRNYNSKNADSSFEVEVEAPYLKIPTDSEVYTSYLTYLNGDQIFDIYDKYGQRLLEQNVRTFLQFRGNVNKGIKNTISGAPSDFFAFNNGITATASKAEMKGNKITKLDNFQIVNGGQTVSSIYAAKKNEKLDVSQVVVQMKLSVIDGGDTHSEFVSKVAEYANTQNKVNKSDFFSNSPFHKDMKSYSARLWVKPQTGSQKMTRWYYERVRGEYLNEQLYLTKAKQKQFLLENPKNQLIDKTFLSKSENAWLQKPYIVSRGAQYCFGDFAGYIGELLEKNQMAITENYFKDAISRIILFRTIEKMISQASWYSGGYRAQTVAYTMSYLSYWLKKQKKHFNFELIWEEQRINEKLYSIIEYIASEIHKDINNPPYGHSNVSQWCKRIDCWERVKNLQLSIDLPRVYLKDKEEVLYEKKEEKTQKKMDSGIEKQTFVLELDQYKWKQIFDYCSKPENRRGISSFGFTALSKRANNINYFPSEAQCIELYSIYERVTNEGLVVI